MSKYLRISILEQEILGSLSAMMRLTIQVNVIKASPLGFPITEVAAKLHELRAYAENIKGFSTLLWRSKALSEGFYLRAMAEIENISKQIAGWEKYLIGLFNQRPGPR